MAYYEVSLLDYIDEVGKENIKSVLSKFVCKENEEVEYFLRERSLHNEIYGFAKTVLIFDSESEKNDIIAYYTITTKSLIFDKKMNSNKRKKFFGTSLTNGNAIPSILIGQLGKNEAISNSNFTGSHLMDMIFRYIINMSILTPSVVAYVEHNGSSKLRKYYEKHDFKYLQRDGEEANGLYCHVIMTKNLVSKVIMK